MGILDRVSTLLRANINDMIDRAEDPEKVVKQLIADMNNQLIQVKTQVAAATCVLTWISWLFMSAMSCLTTFSGSSARSIMSLILALRSVETRSRMPMARDYPRGDPIAMFCS